MAWVVACKAFCRLVDEEVELLEDRRYSQGEGAYTVVARRCVYDVACNLDEHIRCRWNFKPGGFEDPFELELERQMRP